MTSIQTTSDAFMIDLRRAYRAEFDADEAIRAEFITAEDYAAFMVAENPAMIQKMRENCQAVEDEAALRRAEKAGRVRTVHS